MSKQWHVVRAPSTTRLKTMAKEYATQGNIYVVWGVDNIDSHWVSQSLPTLLEAMNKVVSTPRRLNVAACYRIARGECSNGLHKFHRVAVYACNEEGSEQLNEHLQKARSIVFVTKTPQIWKIHGEARRAAREPEVAEEVPEGEHSSPSGHTTKREGSSCPCRLEQREEREGAGAL